MHRLKKLVKYPTHMVCAVNNSNVPSKVLCNGHAEAVR